MDWGIALLLEEREQLPAVMVGTPTSMAPEMITGGPQKLVLTPISTCWERCMNA